MAASIAAFIASAFGALPGMAIVDGDCAWESFADPAAGSGTVAGEGPTAGKGCCCPGTWVSAGVGLPGDGAGAPVPAGSGTVVAD
ncbi:hypothetical protein [Paenarthrobacter sp. 4246]|uniref:hypothetical protein n=1 Tax=Paenarthrobacter sp. 4246 TaxID=3156456 RepID=UPI003392EF83